MVTVRIRQSTINSLEMCPARVGYEGQPGYVDTVSEQRTFGTVLHALINRLVNGETLDDVLYGDVQEFVHATVDECFVEAGQIPNDSMAAGMLAEQIRALTLWEQAVEPLNLELEFSEWKLEHKIFGDDDSEIILQGTPDFVDQNGIIYDWKTSGRAWKEGKAQYSIQAPLYTVLVEAELGRPYRQFTYVVYNRKDSRWDIIDTYPTQDFIDSAVARAITYGEMLETGVFPATPIVYAWGKPSRGWYCSAKWCPAWNICKYKNLPD